MKKKEVLEIKKTFKPENLAITRIEGWVINEEKECIAAIRQSFLTLPEEILFKFLEMFKAALSGTIKKNLYDLEFQEETKKAFLKRVRDERLREESAHEILMEDIVGQLKTTERFAIFLIHGIYDIPGKATDETEMHDASEKVFEYIMACICQVKLSARGLAIKEKIQTAERQWIIGKPDTAFVYPAFTDRSEDYDHVWLYTRKPNEPAEEIIVQVLGCKMPETPRMQKCDFFEMTENTYKLDEAKRIYDDLQALSIDAELSGKGITRQQLESVLGIEHSEKKAEVILQNIINLKSFNVLMEDAEISVSAERTDLIEMREIEGEQYVCIKANGTVYANGMEISNGKE